MRFRKKRRRPSVLHNSLPGKNHSLGLHNSVSSPTTTHDNLIHLHRTLGNAGVMQLYRNGLLQKKLGMGSPDDRYEHEADRVADTVVNMPNPVVQNATESGNGEKIQEKPLAQQITPLIQRQVVSEEQEPQTAQLIQYQEEEEVQAVQMQEEEEELQTVQLQEEEELMQGVQAQEEEEVQAKADGNRSVTGNLASSVDTLRSGGIPLSSSERSFFEPRFGSDLSDVRLHTDTQASVTAKQLNAKAFTVGKHISFGAGQYRPETHQGRRLLGHELTHTIQQNGASYRPQTESDQPSKGMSNPSFESESNENTKSFALNNMKPNHLLMTITPVSLLTVQRQGLLTVAQENRAIRYNRARYNRASIMTIQQIVGATVDGVFGRLSAEAVAGYQNTPGRGLTVDGMVGPDTLNVMVPGTAAAGDHEFAIQLVVDFYNLDVRTDTLSVSYDATQATAGAVRFESGNLRVITLGAPAFTSRNALRNAIQNQLAAPAPAVAAPGPRPTRLTRAEERSAIQYNRRRFRDRRSVLAIQGLVGTGLDASFGPDTVERIAEFQFNHGIRVDGKIGEETLERMITDLHGANQQNAAIRMIMDFYRMRTYGALLDIRYDPAEPDNASTTGYIPGPSFVTVGPSGFNQGFAGLVHSIRHELEHVRQRRAGIQRSPIREFLAEVIEIRSIGMPEEDLNGFMDDAERAMDNWDLMTIPERRRYWRRFLQARRVVRRRYNAASPGDQVTHQAVMNRWNGAARP